MKKIILLFSITFISSAMYAQTDVKTQTTTTVTNTTTAQPAAECYMMKDGKLMHWVGQKEEVQQKMVTLSNGTTITTNGVVTTREGKSQTLTDGQCVAANGAIDNCEKMNSNPKTQ